MGWEEVLEEMSSWVESCQAALASHTGYPLPYLPPSPDALGKLPEELREKASRLLSSIQVLERQVVERRGAVVETRAALSRQRDNSLPLYLDEHT